MNKNLIAGFSLLALALAPAAQAFVFIAGGSYNNGARPVSQAFQWASPTSVTFRINTNQNAYSGAISPELTSAEFITAFTTAASYWNNLCGSNIAVVVGATTSNLFANDGQNTVLWDNRATASGNIVTSANTLAIASPYTNNTTLLLSDCDIVVNGAATGNFAINGNSSDYDLIGVLTHEIGHCLGLDHTIESPTYTSSNPILTTATMSSALSFGDTSFRSLSQDEIDAMECVNSSTRGARNGNFCSSYHGSNGGAALSGVISGGPSAERVCGSGTSAAITTSSASGGGCVSKAIAADGSTPDEPLTLGWMFLGAVFFLGRYLLGRARQIFWILPLGVLLASPSAQAALEISYGRTMAKPANVNSASAMSTYEGTFNSTKAEPGTTFDKFDDLYAALSYTRGEGGNSTLGLYYRSHLEKELALKGYNSANTLLLTKTSKLDGWVVGLVGKWFYMPVATRVLNFFFELQLGMGKTNYSQTILDNTNSTSAITSSATAIETNVYLGGQLPVWSTLDAVLKVGYSRLASNYYSVDSKSGTGTRYSSATVGNRLKLQSGEELRLSRAGLSLQAGLALAF